MSSNLQSKRPKSTIYVSVARLASQWRTRAVDASPFTTEIAFCCLCLLSTRKRREGGIFVPRHRQPGSQIIQNASQLQSTPIDIAASKAASPFPLQCAAARTKETINFIKARRSTDRKIRYSFYYSNGRNQTSHLVNLMSGSFSNWFTIHL